MRCKQYRVLGIIVVLACIMLNSCEKLELKSEPYEKLDQEVSDGMGASLSDENFETVAFSQDNLKHEPYGWDNLYGPKEVPEIWWNRAPRDPQEGELIEINMAVDEETAKKDLWIEWKLNGTRMEVVPCKHVSNLKSSGVTMRKYQGKLGPFVQGDQIEYTIIAGEEYKAQKTSETYAFTVYQWEPVLSVKEIEIRKNTVILKARTQSLTPNITLALLEKTTLKIGIEPEGGAYDQWTEALPFTCDEQKELYQLKNEAFNLIISKEPFSIRITDMDHKKLLTEIVREGLELRTDGVNVTGFRYNISAPSEDKFYGFGMKYDALNQRNKTVHTYCVNWYKDQRGETYTPVPYYFVPNKYGFYMDSTYYSKFEIDSVKDDICSVEVNTRDKKGVNSYFFFGDNAGIADGYTKLVGKPVLPPVWAFGPWISANEWNKQSEVMEQLTKTVDNDIPTSVIVLEAWSDEETFYTFNDSVYTPKTEEEAPALGDFKFGGRWPDPKAMVDQLHENGIKVLLWQIPVLKYSSTANIQSLRDQDYAIQQGYILKNKDESPYHLPNGTWFGNSLLVDFTSEEATQWFLSKRKYLLTELGIDGFKTDGGEFVWGRDLMASDGTKGDELRNAYPDLYAQAYFDYSRNYVKDALTFSRAGGSSMQQHPICWVGDQTSSTRAFGEALMATMSASMSGIPFVAWDIAGFSGELPTSELYQRAIAQAAFSPIMQIHSETSGDPVPSYARTPWNMAERKGNEDCLTTYRYYANVRMNLLPYIYTSAKHSSITGEPLMRSMAYSYPELDMDSKYLYQYMLGDSLLIAPVVDVTKKKLEVFIPEGTWYGLFDHKRYQGGVYTIECPMDAIPVFVKEGSILPMNLNNKLELGGSIGNEIESYQNLTFRIYPGNGALRWYDYVNECEVEIQVLADNKIITVEGFKTPITIELIDKVASIQVNGSIIQGTYDAMANITRFALEAALLKK